MRKVKLRVFAVIPILLCLFLSCNALKTAPYDQYSYQKAIEIKVDAARLMDKATDPYQKHVDAIDELFVEVEKIVIYEQNKPNNGISYQMWKLLSDEDKNLLAGFFKKWSAQGQFSPIFLRESKAQVVEAMDILIQYEGKKDKEAEGRLLNIITGNQ